MLSGQTTKDEIIDRVVETIRNTKAGSYESIYTNYQPTAADTVMKWYYAGKLSYQMNEFDTLCGMNFTYEKREKTFNFDRIERQVYNGYYYYSNQNIQNDIIPDAKYRVLNIEKPSVKKVLRTHTNGQLPQLYHVLQSYPKDQIGLAPDTVVNEEKFHRLMFKEEDSFYGYVVWINAESALPSFVYRYTYVTKTPQLMYRTELRNYEFPEAGNEVFQSQSQVDQYTVHAGQIDTETTRTTYMPILKHIPIQSLAPDIRDSTVTGEALHLTADDQKVRLLYFGMLNCCPCVLSTPHLVKISQTFQTNDNFELCAFYPYDPPAIIKKYVRDHQLTFPVCAGNKQIMKDYGLHAFPDFLLIDKRGKLYKWYRYSETISAELISDIEKLMVQ
jgi:hypothetical protein